MKYRAITLNDGSVFLQRLFPETATEEPLSKVEEVVLELIDKIDYYKSKFLEISEGKN